MLEESNNTRVQDTSSMVGEKILCQEIRHRDADADADDTRQSKHARLELSADACSSSDAASVFTRNIQTYIDEQKSVLQLLEKELAQTQTDLKNKQEIVKVCEEQIVKLNESKHLAEDKYKQELVALNQSECEENGKIGQIELESDELHSSITSSKEKIVKIKQQLYDGMVSYCKLVQLTSSNDTAAIKKDVLAQDFEEWIQKEKLTLPQDSRFLSAVTTSQTTAAHWAIGLESLLRSTPCAYPLTHQWFHDSSTSFSPASPNGSDSDPDVITTWQAGTSPSATKWKLIDSFSCQMILESCYRAPRKPVKSPDSSTGFHRGHQLLMFLYSESTKTLIEHSFHIVDMTMRTKGTSSKPVRIMRLPVSTTKCPVPTTVMYDMPFPKHWLVHPTLYPARPTSQWSNGTVMVPIDVDSARWNELRDVIRESERSMTIQVHVMFQLQNIQHECAYVSRRAQMELEMAEDLATIRQMNDDEENAPDDDDENSQDDPPAVIRKPGQMKWIDTMIDRQLEIKNTFHGTHVKNMQSIIDRGLCIHRSRAAKPDPVNQYGGGVYMSRSSSISLDKRNGNYAPAFNGEFIHISCSTPVQCLFIGDCLTGWSKLGHSSEQFAPPLNRHGYEGSNYHSAHCRDKQILNLWNSDQVRLHTFSIVSYR